jgi:hypothetical protein
VQDQGPESLGVDVLHGNADPMAAPVMTTNPANATLLDFSGDGDYLSGLARLTSEASTGARFSVAVCDSCLWSFAGLSAHVVLGTELTSDEHRHKLLAQVDTALHILEAGGSLVVRFGDSFTRWSAGLLYVLRDCFEAVKIVKPFASMPFDPERFIVCSKFHGVYHEGSRNAIQSAIAKYKEGEHVLAFVPMPQLLERDFMAYLTRSNDRHIARQIAALRFLSHEDSSIPPGTAEDTKFCELGVEAMKRLRPSQAEPGDVTSSGTS